MLFIGLKEWRMLQVQEFIMCNWYIYDLVFGEAQRTNSPE